MNAVPATTISWGTIPEWITVVATLAAVVFAWRSAVAAREAAQSARATVEYHTLPSIWIYLRNSIRGAPWPELVIANRGNSPAFNIDVSGNWHDVESLLGPKHALLKKRIPAIAPGQELVIELTDGWRNGKPVPELDCPVEMAFSSKPEQPPTIHTPGLLSIKPLIGTGLEVSADPLRAIAAELRTLQSNVNAALIVARKNGLL